MQASMTLMQHRQDNPYRRLQIVAAVAALLAGALIYLLARDPQQIFFMKFLPLPNTGMRLPSTALSYSMPSFLHIYAFILFSNAIMTHAIHRLRLITLFWLLVEVFFEIGQHDAVAPLIVDAMAAWPGHHAWLRPVAGYFIHGRFDLLDITALLLGSLAAYCTVLAGNRLLNRTGDVRQRQPHD